MRIKTFLQSITLASFILATTFVGAQTWSTLTNSPPNGVQLCMLLTDGGVMCQSGSAWYKLTPDLNGSYLNGTWTTLASLPSGYNPDAFASAVLADGRVVIVGGEYNNGNFALTNMGAVYDPIANAWTMLTPPSSGGSPNYFQCIGDAPATVLADGRLIIGSKLYQNLAILDPSNLSWSVVSATGKIDGFNSEEGWTLLPDGSFFTLDVKNAPSSERFLLTGSTSGVWASSGSTLQDLHTPTTSGTLNAQGCPPYNPPGEIGPTLLLPNGTVFAIGADGLTGIYTPPAAGSIATGSWAIGPAMPSGLNVEDGPGAVLPSGHVLFGGSPGASGSGLKYFEFDGTNLISVPAPGSANNDATYFTSLLVLPTGQVMFVDSSNTVQLYTSASSPSYLPGWAPTISSVPSTINNGTTYLISGTQFNGLNQGSAFGDEYQNATNYPLVRITNNATGHVFYARTHNHSTMGVATGSATVSTYFDVPTNIENGPSMIQVVANGIPSAPVAVTASGTNSATTTQVSCSPNPSGSGQLVTCTSTTTSTAGVPSGSVTFAEGSNVFASNVAVNNSGHASFSTNALSGGTHTIAATFTGSTGWANSSGSTTQSVVDFTLSVSPSSQSAPPNTNNVKYAVVIGSVNGFNSTVTFSVSGLPAGVTGSFSPNSVNGSGNSSLTINTGTGMPGSYSLTITASSGAISHSALVSLTILQPDFTISVSPSSQSAAPNTNNVQYSVVIGSINGFNSTVTFSVSGLPTGSTC